MASRSRRRQPEQRPRFFIDRGLGKGHVPAVFRQAGYEVVLMSDLYPGGEDQRVGDDRWIREVSELGLVALTKDVAIARAHRPALEASRIQIFALANANLTGPEMAARFNQHLHRIVQHARKPGPYVYVLGRSRLERRWPLS